MGGISDDYANAFVVIQFGSDLVNAPKVAQGDVAGGSPFAKAATVTRRTEEYIAEEALHIAIVVIDTTRLFVLRFDSYAKMLPTSPFVAEVDLVYWLNS